MEQEEQHLTVQEAAQILGVPEQSVRTALQENRLPFSVKFGLKIIARADLDAYRQRTRAAKRQKRPRKALAAERRTNTHD